MKLAIFGGSFNPIHYGHIHGAISVLETFSYDKIIFVPAFKVTHKDTSKYVSPNDRYNMVKLAIEKYNYFDISDYEIKKEEYSYTIDTVNYFYNNYNINGKLGVIIGDDLIDTLDNWKEIDKLQNIADLICLKRININCNTKYRINFIENRIIEISSTEIIERINQGKIIDFLLPEKVKDYIINLNLYKE